jgi:hypothetical protein
LQFIGPLAQSYLQESEFEQAAIWLDRLVALDPGNLQVSEAHAILLCQIGRRALALRRLDIALARRPDEAADESTKVLRFTATTLRRYDDAVREMRTSPEYMIFDAPDEPREMRLWRKALMEYARRDYQSAIQFLFALDPRYGAAPPSLVGADDRERLRGLILKDLDIRPAHFREPDGTRILVIRSTSSGFCADVAHAAIQVIAARACGRTPLIHWGQESAYADPAIDNLWTEFFEPVSSLGLDELRSRPVPCYPPSFTPGDLRWSHNRPWFANKDGVSWPQIVARAEEIAVVERFSLISEVLLLLPDDHPLKSRMPLDLFLSELPRAVRLKPDILAEARSWLDRHRQGGPVLALHLRLSSSEKVDDSLEQGWPNFAAVIDLLTDFVGRHPSGRIFLLSDYQPYVDRLHERFPGRVIARPAMRLTETTARERQLGLGAPTGNFHLAVEVVRDIATASLCDAFIGDGASGVSTVIAGLGQWPAAQLAWIRSPNVLGSRWSSFVKPPRPGDEVRRFSVQAL